MTNSPPSFASSRLRVNEILEQHFDTAFAAPGGIARLRELILTLAMQGKLVEQNPNDPPASELLKEIEKERASREGAKTRRKEKKLPPIKAEEVPYELPRGWEWVRLNDAFDVRDGTHDTPKYVDVGYPLVTSKNIYTGSLSLNDVKYISKEDHEKIAERSRVDKGDILFAMIGSIGNPVIVDCDIGFSIKNVALFKCFIAGKPSNRYLHYYLVHAQKNMKAISSGAVQSFVSLGFLRNHLLPLPPLPEQHRIVAKIDQLMARCDALEKLRKEREAKRLAVHATAIKQLLDPAFAPSRLRVSQDSSNLRAFVPSCEPFAFLAQHFGELYTVKENVAELRKAILQLAVMGRLVPQDPNDPPASELMKEIEAEKQRLVKAGKIKKYKPLPPIEPGEVPCELPQGWEWVRLGELIELISGQHLTPDEYNENGIGHSYYTGPADFGALNPRATRWTTVDRSMAINGDILLTVKGAGVGKTNVLTEEMAAISRQLMALRVVRVNRDYVLRFVGTIFYELQALAIGIAIPGIGRDDVLLRKFPLPPLSEQHRIVARIDQLMSLCDTLNQQIDAATGKQTELLNAVMAPILGTAQ